MKLSILCALALVPILAGCGSGTDASAVNLALQAQSRAWKAQNIPSYWMTVKYGPGPGALGVFLNAGPFRVHVVNGTPVEVQFTENVSLESANYVRPVILEKLGTVENIFDYVRNAENKLDKRRVGINVIYNEKYQFPENYVFINREELDLSDPAFSAKWEFNEITVSDFQPDPVTP
jgi:hypothetical protein